MLAAMSVSPGLTGAHLPAVVVIFCRGLEQHDNPQFSRVIAFKQHMRCMPDALAGRSRRPARCTLATCRARSPAAEPAATGPTGKLHSAISLAFLARSGLPGPGRLAVRKTAGRLAERRQLQRPHQPGRPLPAGDAPNMTFGVPTADL
jgi:hypothetical protein